MNFQDVMLDLETLGTKRGCVVLSIGMVAFGPSGLGPEWYDVPDTQEQIDAGLHEDPDTVTWWQKQSAEARKVFSEPRRPLGEVLTDTAVYLANVCGKTKLRVWGNGSDFDNQILADVYEAAGRKIPWLWYNNRCYRTLKGMDRSIKLERVGTHHNALGDAKSQAQHAVVLLNELGLWAKLRA